MNRRPIHAFAGLSLIAATHLAFSAVARAQPSYDDEPIRYSAGPVDDPIARLQRRLDAGDATLTREGPQGYLKSLLAALRVPRESQVLVFSKTSFQRSAISPQTPRALYFSDDAYVGWVKGGDVLEIATIDPRQGTIFYLLPQRPEKPRFIRQTHACLQCHDGSAQTGGVPGLMVRSVFPGSDGEPKFSAGTFLTTPASPLSERWGGWYVTGSHGRQRHMGNVTVGDADPATLATLDRERGANVLDLESRFDQAPYLGRGSDLVALMVMEHQLPVHNLITSASYETRRALRDEETMNKLLGEPEGHRQKSTTNRISAAAESLVRALLFSGEIALTDPVAGTSGFARSFSALGPRDRKGRSLRDLDLRRRLLRYPCSPLIYGESFEALPTVMKEQIYRRLWDVLSGRDQTPPFAHLTPVDRQTIREILRDTKPSLPAYWR
jgi:hypothetical protein